MHKKTEMNRAKHVSTGTGDIVKQKIASMSIVKKSVNSTSVEAIAEIETVTNDTKILADILE